MTPDVKDAPSLSVLPSPAIEAQELSLSVGGASLLKRADFTVRRGEIALLCAPSGAGKTILLKLLAGVLRAGHDGVAADGRLRFEQTDLLSQLPPPGRVGILFQNHALFDELSARENVLFALRHRVRGAAAAAAAPDRAAGAAIETVAAQELLEGLGVGGAGRLRHLSGGQLQRVALARTLALDPDLILYDEPTTGLDAANARLVAEMIRAAHGRRPRTTLIVTHDLEAFRAVASAALWLDPASGKVERLTLDEAVARAAQPIESDARPAAAGGGRRALPLRLLERTADAVGAAGLAVARLFPSWPRARYGVRYLGHYLRIAASPGAFLYVGVAGLLVGFVATYFTFEKMPRRDVTEPLFVDDVLSALGFMLFRVLAPVLVTLLVAARTGAAFAADIGGKVYARQFDALRSFGVDPSRYLLTGLLQSLLLAMPFLVWVMWWAAELSALLVFLFTHPDRSAFFWERGFTRGLINEDFFLHWGWMWVLAKTEACAFGIAAIAWFVGSREKLAADDVSRAVTRTVILASLHVLLVHFLFSFIEF
jgi:ABC-type transporter Mla maintaining outer membrane lipid asymmetry ATPase subunit MlaF/ABC-type transporter Mla maintaining outer membrane lipid asymmetry permease subunit MlaE